MLVYKFGLVALFTIALAGCAQTSTALPDSQASTSANSASPEQTVEPDVTYESLMSAGDPITTSGICKSYANIMNSFSSKTQAKLKLISGKSSDPYKAQAFVARNSWLESSQLDVYDEKLGQAVIAALNIITGGRASEVTQTSIYETDSVAACKLTDLNERVRSRLVALDSQAQAIVDAADSVPWYPKGFSELEDGLAYIWLDHPNCDYGTRCVEAVFIAEYGCQSGLYVEVNFLHNGTVVDWSNDSVPGISEMQKARLKFSTYDDTASQTELSDWSCHT